MYVKFFIYFILLCFYITLDMASRPEALEELYEEASRIDKECNGILTVADVKKMVKLDSFVKESLRHNDNQSKYNFNFPYILN